MYPWCFSLHDHLRCMTTESFTLHLIEKEDFRTGLLYHLFTTLHDQKIFHGKCKHCWIQEDSNSLKNIFDTFSHYELYTSVINSIQIDSSISWTHLKKELSASVSHVILECCDSNECLERLYAGTEICQQPATHVIIKLPEHPSTVQTILDRFLTPPWCVLTDSLLYDDKQWTYLANVESSSCDFVVNAESSPCYVERLDLNESESIDLEKKPTFLKGNLKCLLNEIDKWYHQQRIDKELRHDDVAGDTQEIETKSNTQELCKHTFSETAISDVVISNEKSDNVIGTKSDTLEPCKLTLVQNKNAKILSATENNSENFIETKSNTLELQKHTTGTATEDINEDAIQAKDDTSELPHKVHLSKCYVVCNSQQDSIELFAHLCAQHSNSEGVHVRCVTKSDESIGDINEETSDILIVVMTTESFLSVKYCCFEIVLIDVQLETFVEYVQVNSKLLAMHLENVVFTNSSNNELFNSYGDLLRKSITLEYMGPRLSEDYWKLKRLCDSFSVTTYTNVDMELRRTYKEDLQTGSMVMESVIYLPMVSMTPYVAKGDVVTMPSGSSKEDLISKSDESALRNAVQLAKEAYELDADGKVMDRSSFNEEDVNMFVDITTEETESDDLFELLISPEEKVDVYKFKTSELLSKDGNPSLTIHQPDTECLGMCIKRRLNQIPPFTLCDHYGCIEVVSQYSFSTEIAKEDFITIQQFQECVFEKVCNMNLKKKSYLEERTDTKLVFLRRGETNWSIDYARMHKLYETFVLLFEKGGENTEIMNDQTRCNGGVLVLPKHTLPEMKRPLLVCDHNPWLMVTDDFPDQSKAHTYQEYYSTKYNVSISDNETLVPLKHVKFVLSSINTVDYSVRKKSSGKQMDIPQMLCCMFPLSFYLWRQFCLLPSILYRLKQNEAVHKLIHHMTLVSNNDLSLRNHVSGVGGNDLQVDNHLSMVSDNDLSLRKHVSGFSGVDLLSPLQNCATVMEYVRNALISPSAVEDVNNEEMEFYGDAVLKYAIVTQLFLDNPRKSESYLSFHKSRIVMNERLYKIGIAKQLYKYLFFEKFNPKILHSYMTIEKHPYKSTDFKKQFNKVISDVAESLLGAFFAAGSEHWIALLRWYGFDIKAFEKFLAEKKFYVELFKTGNTFENEATVLYLTASMSQLENTLQYKFKDPLLYLEACSHVTYPRRLNLWTHSNQRIECIGDAVLDIMVTTALINRNKEEGRKYDHGGLSEMRSFIVCTYVLAVLAVKMGLHKHLKFMSARHLAYIKKWIEKVMQLQESKRLYSKKHYEAYVSCDGGEQHVEVPKDLADCFEAVVGAVYLDVGGNLHETWKCFEGYFKEVIDISFAHMPISIYYYLASISPEGQFESLPHRVNGDYCWRWSDGNLDIVRTGRTSKVAKGRVVMAAVESLKMSDVTA